MGALWPVTGDAMGWWQFALLGAGGGLSVELPAVFRGCAQWQAARRTATGRRRTKPPALRQYPDTSAHACLAVLRAAVALGGCAPAVLTTLGADPQVAGFVTGGTAPVEASLESTRPGGAP